MVDLSYADTLQELSTDEIAREFGVSERTARRWKQRAREKIEIPDAAEVGYQPTREIYSDGAVIYSDVHSPLYNKSLFLWAMRFQEKWKIPTAVFPGDLHDMRAVSPWVPDVGVQLGEDLIQTGKLINAVEKISDAVEICQGNHEGWIDKLYARQFTSEMIRRIMQLNDKTYISEKHFIILHDACSTYPWAIGHPDEYSQVKGAVSTGIANKLWMNILTTHEHASYTTYSLGDQVVVAAIGCLADVSKLGYLIKKFNKKPVPNMGFAIVKNGKLYNFHDGFTDWDAMLKCY